MPTDVDQIGQPAVFRWFLPGIGTPRVLGLFS